jgi:hypothetical protein
MKKNILSLIFLFFVCFKATAQQEYFHNIVWGRLVLSDTINKKLKWEMYFQHRRQNTQQTDSDAFEANQFTSYWPWLHYSIAPNTKISVSPIGYFKSWILITQASDLVKESIEEWRVSARIDHESKGKYFNLINRYGIEYRQRDLLNNGIFQPNWRVRYMLRLEKPIKFKWLKSSITLVANDEIFIQFGKAVKGNPNIFDQNRIYLGFNYPITKSIKASLGHVWGIQARNSGKEIDHYNIVWGILTFDNLFSQFKKSSKKS